MSDENLVPQILIAEDTRVHQKLLAAMIERHGYEVDIANNGREVVEMARAKSYDAIFMDCNMPQFGGMEAAAAIKKLLGDAKPPIIGITADTESFVRDACLEAGMDDFAPKPHTLAKIKELLERWVEVGE